ncbi:hypothetical protein GCM10008929_07550 [Alkalibacterium psychrotolerans]
MTDTIGRLIIISLMWAGIIYQFYQYRRIQIPLRKAAFFKYKRAQAVALVALLLLLFFLNLQVLDWLVVLSAALFIHLSQFNKGFTSKGVIPYEIGTALRAMISREYRFEHTKEWVMDEDADSLTLRFHTRQASGYEKELTFDKKNKEAVLNKLAEQNIKVKLAEQAEALQ